MAYQLFHLPKAVNISTAFQLQPGAKANFYATGTTTPQDTYQNSTLTTPHANPVVADAAGFLAPIYLDPTLVYKLTLTDANDVLIYTVDPVNDQLLTQALIGETLWPLTDIEEAASITPQSYAFPPYDVRRYGATGDGVTDDRLAFQRCIDLCRYAGGTMVIPTPPSFYLIGGALDCTTDTTDEIRGFTIRGESNILAVTENAPYRPTIIFSHTGHCFDMAGSYGINFENLAIGTSTSTVPATCFFMARNQDGNSQAHHFTNVRVYGNFSEAIEYNYGSEDSVHLGCVFFNIATTANAKCVVLTAANIRSLSSTFITITTGTQSMLGHAYFGGQYAMRSDHANADCFYLDNVTHLRIVGAWLNCANLSGGGRSLIYVNTTNGPSNYGNLIACQGEASSPENVTYGVYMGDTTATCSGWQFLGCTLPNVTNILRSHANVTMNGLCMLNTDNQSQGGGVNIAGTLQASYVDARAGSISAGSLGENNVDFLNRVLERAGEVHYTFRDSSQSANNRVWRVRNTGGTLVFSGFNDALNSATSPLQLGRTGAAAPSIGFFDAGTLATKQTVTGSRGGNAALASLLTALAAYGLITDSSSA